jgi:catechol 2,3-dioxygenase-like lactoylglutathione lyase family enzyme
MQLTGIHHLTAISAKPRENLAFYTGLLGMRLVKKTVNQDDVSAYARNQAQQTRSLLNEAHRRFLPSGCRTWQSHAHVQKLPEC